MGPIREDSSKSENEIDFLESGEEEDFLKPDEDKDFPTSSAGNDCSGPRREVQHVPAALSHLTQSLSEHSQFSISLFDPSLTAHFNVADHELLRFWCFPPFAVQCKQLLVYSHRVRLIRAQIHWNCRA